MRNAIRVLVMALAVFGTAIVVVPQAQAATACASGGYTTQDGGDYAPSQYLVGVRAPIQELYDGLVCSSSAGLGTADWIGIQNNVSGGGLSQMGFAHIWNPVLQEGEHCTFYENTAVGSGRPVYQACVALLPGAYDYFKIHETTSGYYALDYCGQLTGYTTCTTWNAQQAAFNEPVALMTSESQSACQEQLMGESTGAQNIGFGSSAGNQVNFQFFVNGSWAVGPIATYHFVKPSTKPACAQYKSSVIQSGHVVTTYDTRQTS